MERCASNVPFHVDAALNLALIYFFFWIYVIESAYSCEASQSRRDTATAYWSHSNV
jgi:hypothetical protein